VPPTTPAPSQNAVFALERVLRCASAGEVELQAALAELERSEGDDAPSVLLRHLATLELEPAEARAHLERIVERRRWMSRRLGTPVDLRVALFDHFLAHGDGLEDPLLLERDVYDRTWDSAYRDALTGLYNYRYFSEYLSREILRSERHGWPLSLVMLDLDDFKRYNDRHGHEAGNDALATLGRILEAILRRSDLAARYGGEEFALILPNTAKTGAAVVAERARNAVEDAFPGANGEGFRERVTVSIGIATYPADAPAPEALVRQADRAMYGAKGGGKNRVQLFGHSTRSFRRVDAPLAGSFRAPAGEDRELTAVSLSEAGLSFVTSHPLGTGSLIDLRLSLPGVRDPLCASARVVRTQTVARGRFEIVARFTEVDTRQRNLLTRYIAAAVER